MKSLEEMRRLVDSKTAQVLTTGNVNSLKGKKIQVFSYGYKGQDHTDEFIVGSVTNELEYYRQLDEECFKGGKFQNRAEYWESYMTKEQLEDKKAKNVLLREDGSYTFIYTYDEVFVCSDDNRCVFFVEAES